MKSSVRQLQLFETAGCHLCADAQAILLPLIVQSPDFYQLTRVDIAGVEDLLAQYGVRIPVIKRLDSGAELGWPFGVAELEFFLR